MTKETNHNSFKELYESRHEPENLRPLAEVYWRVVLLSSFAAVIGIICFGVWEFSSVMSTISGESTDAATQQPPAIDRTLLENTLAKFSERTANFELSKSIVPPGTDPSLK